MVFSEGVEPSSLSGQASHACSYTYSDTRTRPAYYVQDDDCAGQSIENMVSLGGIEPPTKTLRESYSAAEL
jgi:hypothetical protein